MYFENYDKITTNGSEKMNLKKKEIFILASMMIVTMVFLTISSTVVVRADSPVKRFGTKMCYAESNRIILYGGLQGGLIDQSYITWYKDTCLLGEPLIILSEYHGELTYILFAVPVMYIGLRIK